MGKKVTIGYWYGASLHMALAHSVDALTEVIVGDKSAWTGNLTANGTITIARPDLFGGEEREGGPDGTLTVAFGASTQPPDGYLAGKFGASTPAFRGVTTALWRGRLAAMNPYIKPWRFRVRRMPSGWYTARAAIGDDANPAHIIRECLTDATWGLGWPAADIDDASFTAAADTLYSEGFGLSLLWDRETAVEDFIAAVVRHIDAALYVHPRTGRFTIKLVRDDYSAPSLPLLDRSNLLGVEEFSRPALGELVNQIVLTYRDGAADEDRQITVQDIAMIAAQGGVVSQSVAYPGIAQAALAARVAQRELRQLGSGLARATLTADRRAASLLPGDAFRWSWPPYGIVEMVMRVARIGYGDHGDGRVRIEAVQDVFGLPAAAYAAVPTSGWADPISLPAPCPAQAAIETPYWLVVQDVVGEIPSILADISPDDGLVAALGARPSSDAVDYRCMAYDAATASWVDRGRGAWSPTGLLAAAMPQEAGPSTVTLAAGALDLAATSPGDLALVDDELMVVTAVDASALQLTLARGALDSVPSSHAAGARLWVLRAHYVQPEYVYGETAQLRLLPRTGRGELAVSSAATVTRAIARRFIRPYPPGQVKLNGAYYPAAVAGDVTVSWARRNRVQQTAEQAPRFTDADVTPEAGATVTIRIYGGAGQSTLRRTYSGLTGTTQTWSTADAAADGAADDGRVRLEIEAVRTDGVGTFTSLYRHDIAVDRAGWGMHWGNYYGGV